MPEAAPEELAISSSLNGSVGVVVIFGGFTPFAGFSSSHFDDTQNERNARSRSSFLWAEIAPSFQLARNSRSAPTPSASHLRRSASAPRQVRIG
jgi:hypothetical protein